MVKSKEKKETEVVALFSLIISGLTSLSILALLVCIPIIITFLTKALSSGLNQIFYNIQETIAGQIDISIYDPLIAFLLLAMGLMGLAGLARFTYLYFGTKRGIVKAARHTFTPIPPSDEGEGKKKRLGDITAMLKAMDRKQIYINIAALGVGIVIGLLIPIIFNVYLSFKSFNFLGQKITFFHISIIATAYTFVLIYIYPIRGKYVSIIIFAIGLLLGMSIMSLF